MAFLYSILVLLIYGRIWHIFPTLMKLVQWHLRAPTAEKKTANTRKCHLIDCAHSSTTRMNTLSLEPAHLLWTIDQFACFSKLSRLGDRISWTVLIFRRARFLLLGSCDGVLTSSRLQYRRHRKFPVASSRI
ncbi:hypothetical protein H4582DRAFT_12087 [Lactarius indigo]|nr:hypothetical protein H4582DRAFT_12087 [Lactarius indigo]